MKKIFRFSTLALFLSVKAVAAPATVQTPSFEKDRAVVVGNQLLHLETLKLNANETLSIVITGGINLMNFSADCVAKKAKYTSVYANNKLIEGSDRLQWEDALDSPRGGNTFTAPFNVLCSSLVQQTLQHAAVEQ